jgi:hypothetical protein
MKTSLRIAPLCLAVFLGFVVPATLSSCQSSGASGAELVAEVRGLEKMEWKVTGDASWDALGVPAVESFNLWREGELERFEIIDKLQGEQKYFDKFEAAVDKELSSIKEPTPEQRKDAAKRVAASSDFKGFAKQLANIYELQAKHKNDGDQRMKALLAKVVEFVAINAAKSSGLNPSADALLKARNLKLLKDIPEYTNALTDLNARRGELAADAKNVFSEI